MSFVELLTGGECEWPGRRPARFTFRVSDFDRVQQLLENMFVELTVRPMRGGGMAFCLDVPDRDLGTWSIPIKEGDRIKLARGAGECTARIVNERATKALDLAPFCEGLRHDWSGKVAAAFADLACGKAREAAAALEPVAAMDDAVPAAHHLLGRCHRALGRLTEAVECYRNAVRASADESGKLQPWAAAPLSDMGVAYKRQGDAARAIHCFLHSLHLRPNHPEALLSFFSLMAVEEGYVLFGAARVLAMACQEELVDEFLDSYATVSGREIATLRAEALKLSEKVDLAKWPLQRAAFEKLSAFERGLDMGKAVSAAAAVMRAGRWGPGGASA
ncbi:MAG: tetratricopeptide repeat protein [Myxococcales bacterium]